MDTRKIFVLDTNVILHDPLYYKAFKEHDIVIPLEVIIELDKFKKGDGEINFNARSFFRFIDDLPSKEIHNGGAVRGEGLGKIRIIVSPQYHGNVKKLFPEKSVDHLILNSVYNLVKAKENKGKEIVFVSKDVSLRIKAKALGLTAEDYENNAVSDLRSIYENVKNIKVNEEVILHLYDDKIDVPATEGIKNNEFAILTSLEEKDKAVLVVCKDDKFIPVKKNQDSSFGISSRNSEQAFALHALLDPSISLVTISGQAGTGKTIISLAAGLKCLEEKKVDYLFFTRQTISLGNVDIGFLPGDALEKVSPYMQPLYDNLNVMKNIKDSSGKIRGSNAEKIKKFMDEGRIVIQPLPFLRGRSLERVFFIIDESQNLTPGEVKTITTRAGTGTKIILVGDITQIDHPFLDAKSNGLSYLISKFMGQDVYSNIVLKKGERSYLAELASNLL